MDNQSEHLKLEIAQRIAQSNKQISMADKAIKIIGQEITSRGTLRTLRTFDPIDAIRLACLRVAYRVEWQLYQEDRARLRVELGENVGLRFIEKTHEMRLKNEAILFAATRGNYEPLKNQLAGEAGAVFPELIELNSAIPAKGEPFRPPRPSWQDPEIINAPNPKEPGE